MVRLFSILLLGATAFAHGGAFRPPPRPGPRDPTRGPAGPTVTTVRPGGGTLTSWESWWNLNRARYLRIRERMIEREVITGPARRTDLFDRRVVREVLIPEVMKALKDDAAQVRGAACIVAGKFQATVMIPQLLKIYRRDKKKEVREAAVLGLLHMRDKKLIPDLREIAVDDDQSRRIRGFAVLALGFVQDTDHLEQLMLGQVKIPGSNTAVEDVRACAALALGYAGDQSKVVSLLKMATSKHAPRSVVGFASSALGRLGSPMAQPEVISLIKSRKARKEARLGASVAVGSLVRRDETGVIDILGKKALRDREDRVRAELAISLGRIGGERAETHLVAGLPKKERILRGYYYLALGISGSPDAGALLAKEFPRIRNNGDRAACAIALGLCNHKAAAPMLRKEVKKAHPTFAPHGMVALGLLDDKESIPVVQKILARNATPIMRREGAIALALLRRSAAIPELVKLFEKSKSFYTRGAIAGALGLVGTDLAVPPLLRIFRDKRRLGEERGVALAALGRIGDPNPIPLLTQIAFDLNPYIVVDAVGEALTIL